jgi:hypothetical protein
LEDTYLSVVQQHEAGFADRSPARREVVG